jgi:NAD(P)-dependent dehydrogenase (short-subunit alcohol dehydrogenase family)
MLRMNPQEIQELHNFTGQMAVITGGSGVLGSEMVAAFAGLGANVAVLSRSGDLPPEIAERLKNALARCSPSWRSRGVC